MAKKKTSTEKKYGEAAQKYVESAVHREKKGTLKSGSGQTVTSRKQAIAIGLSEAREKGSKVPKAPAKKKTTATKTAKTSGTKKTSKAKK